MSKKTPPFPHYPEWTTSRFWSFVRSTLRRAWSRWPPKYQVLNKAKRTVEGQRHKYEYQCSECKHWFKAKEVEVDHIVPVGSLKDYSDLPAFVERLFVAEDSLRCICKPCHRKKTHG
jgi:5-methylcytosine-specific restriction endonuclease McrA